MPNGFGGAGRQRRGRPPMACVCPKCGREVEKSAGVPCRSQKCPECGTPMMGK